MAGLQECFLQSTRQLTSSEQIKELGRREIDHSPRTQGNAPLMLKSEAKQVHHRTPLIEEQFALCTHEAAKYQGTYT